MVIMWFTVMIVLAITPMISRAEGSKELNPDDNGYRAFTEWYNTTTANISRKQQIQVYAIEGETLYFGSSGTENGGKKDIVLYDPEGLELESYDTKADGAGFIKDRTQELAGPDVDGSGEGYQPLSYAVKETGVYTMEFRSASESSVENPNPQLASAAFVKDRKAVLDAWDVTVYADGEEKTGRVFANWLAVNAGNRAKLPKKNIPVLESEFYVLTKDGYIYRINLNGMDPYGFIIFANNRGLIQKSTNTSLYHSIKGKDNSLSDLYQYDAQLPIPTSGDTDLDQIYKIFFNEPSDDLPEWLKVEPEAPGAITPGSFYFYGDKKNGGLVGQGGYFYFECEDLSSFQIEIDLRSLKDENGNSRGVVVLSNAAIAGENKIYWDGRDANGKIVPEGEYDPETCPVRLITKAGEYHFPVIDAENNVNGLKITLMNNPSGETGKESYVYYDNTQIGFKTTDITRADGTVAELNSKTTPTDSTNGAMWFKNESGDYTILDVWTYNTGDLEDGTLLEEGFSLKDPEVNRGMLTGFTFYDTNKNGSYSLLESDYGLSNCTVRVFDQDNQMVSEMTTPATGYYSIFDLPYGDYTVQIVSSKSGSRVTTAAGTEFQVTIDAPQNAAPDTGFYYERSKEITVYKLWKINDTIDTQQPISVTVTAVTDERGGTTYSQNAVLSKSNGWSYTFYDLPMYGNDGKTVLNWTVEELIPEGYRNEIEISESTSRIIYFITNIPDGTITLTKEDPSDQSPLEGAKFKLYKVQKAEDLLMMGYDSNQTEDGNEIYSYTGEGQFDTFETNESGQITITGLPFGIYYFKETEAPKDYIISKETTEFVQLEKDDNQKEITVYNSRQKDLSVTKIWKDSDDKKGLRPNQIGIVLSANGTDLQTVYVSASKNGSVSTATSSNAMPLKATDSNAPKEEADSVWNYTFQDLPEYDEDGERIEYTIRELENMYYDSEVEQTSDTSWNITNTLKEYYTNSYKDIFVKKTWMDGGDESGKRPKSVKIQLKNKQTGEVCQTAKIQEEFTSVVVTATASNATPIPPTASSSNAEAAENENLASPSNASQSDAIPITGSSHTDEWSILFINVPVYDKSGNEIEYEVVETSLSSKYQVTYNRISDTEFEIINSIKRTIKGQKYWVGDENHLDYRPEAITVKLYADGEYITEQTVTSENLWRYKFKDLPMYNEIEREIEYEVKEVPIAYYDTSYGDFDEYDITNTFNERKEEPGEEEDPKPGPGEVDPDPEPEPEPDPKPDEKPDTNPDTTGPATPSEPEKPNDPEQPTQPDPEQPTQPDEPVENPDASVPDKPEENGNNGTSDGSSSNGNHSSHSGSSSGTGSGSGTSSSTDSTSGPGVAAAQNESVDTGNEKESAAKQDPLYGFEENQTPLSRVDISLPKTGDTSGRASVIFLFALLALGIYSLQSKKERK